MKVRIIHNGQGSGDHTEITVDGNLVFEGYHPDPAGLVEALKVIEGHSGVEYHSVTDEYLDNRGYAIGSS